MCDSASAKSDTSLLTIRTEFAVKMLHAGFVAVAYCLASIGYATAATNLGWKPGWKPADTSATDLLAAKGLFNLGLYELEGHRQANCSLANAAVRREW